MCDSRSSSLSEALSRGAELFNAGEYHAALDAFEEPYHDRSFKPRELVLGLIRVSAALYHFKAGRSVSAVKLYHSGVEILSRFSARECGFEVKELIQRLDETFKPLLDLDPSAASEARPGLIPQIRLKD